VDQVEGAPGFERVAHHTGVRVKLAAQFLDKACNLPRMDIRHQVHIQRGPVNAVNTAGHRTAYQIGNRAAAQRLDQCL
jgi:hypothetical protein